MIETDVDALIGHAVALGAAGSGFATAGADLHTTWQGLVAHYRAPEADYLFASTGPVRDISGSVGEDVEVVGSVLSGYAEEVREIQARLQALRVAAADFEASVAHQPDWSADQADVDRSNDLLGQVTAAAGVRLGAHPTRRRLGDLDRGAGVDRGRHQVRRSAGHRVRGLLVAASGSESAAVGRDG